MSISTKILDAVTASRTPRVPMLCLGFLITLTYLFSAPAIIMGDTSLDSLATNADSGSGAVVRQVLYILIFATVVYQLIRHRNWYDLWNISLPTALILLWCWLSVGWAVDPSIAIRRLIFMTVVSLSVIYLTQILATDLVLQVVVASCFVVLSLDLVAIALFPLAVHTVENGATDDGIIGNWRGLHNHKNEAGPFCAITCLLMIHETWRSKSRFIGPLAIAAAALFLWKSVSKTSIAFMVPSLLIGVFAHYAYELPRLRAVALFGVALALIGAVAMYGDWFIDDFVQSTLADAGSFTGRGQIWKAVLDYARDHLWFGAGYGSFWGIGVNSPVFDYATGWVTEIYSTHNGYLNLLVTLGLPGLLLAVSVLIAYPLYLGFFMPLSNAILRSLLVSIIAFIALHDFLESSILEPSEPTWIMMLVMVSLMDKETRSWRRRVSL